MIRLGTPETEGSGPFGQQEAPVDQDVDQDSTSSLSAESCNSSSSVTRPRPDVFCGQIPW